MGELRSVGSVVGYLMHNDQMMVGLDGNLDVVADDAGTAAAGRHRTGIGIGQRYLLVRGGKHLHLETLETGTVRNSVSEAIMMEGKGASYGYRERPAGPTFSWA